MNNFENFCSAYFPNQETKDLYKFKEENYFIENITNNVKAYEFTSRNHGFKVTIFVYKNQIMDIFKSSDQSICRFHNGGCCLTFKLGRFKPETKSFVFMNPDICFRMLYTSQKLVTRNPDTPGSFRIGDFYISEPEHFPVSDSEIENLI